MPMGEALDTAIAGTGNERLAREWALVLAASAIEHRLEPTPAGWTLVVRAADVTAASAALADYEAERRAGAPIESGPAPAGRPWLGAVVAGLLVGFFAITGPRAARSFWFERGAASAGLILDGEPWRVVTALTLHADLAHVLGNALACVVLVTAVGRLLGAGLGLWLVLLAGAGGNALAALAHGSRHISVGASTSTFGALGVLGALQIVAGRLRPATRRRAWLVGTASVLLLVLLGTASRADVLAHAFGLAAGGVLGLVAARALREPPGPTLQRRLLLAAAVTVIACWALALGSTGAGR
jgi:membrane associated rhomboid family serine protease